MNFKFTKSLAFSLILSGMMMSNLWAMSFGSDDAPDIKVIKEIIEKEDYPKAIEQLQLFLNIDDNKNNADAWNLLGFSQRKSGDFEGAGAAYEKALSIDPKHLDALEYQGELFLMMKDMVRAKENGLKLQALCPSGCEQLTHFEEVISSGVY